MGQAPGRRLEGDGGDVAQQETGQDLTEDPWMLAAATDLAEEIKQELSTRSSATRPLPVNGKPVMVLTNPRRKVDDREEPLTKGKIQIQSEGAEVFYRNIKIRPLP